MKRIKVSTVFDFVRLIANITFGKQSLLGAYIPDNLPVLLERGA